MSNDQQHSNDGIVHYEGGLPIFDSRLDNLENEAREAKVRDGDYKKEQLVLDRRLVGFTAVLAMCGILGAAISGWQASIASRTIGEIQETREQTKRDNASAITAQQAIAQDALAKSQENFERSSRQAETANRQSQRFFAEGNRPWLFVQPGDASHFGIQKIEAGAVLKVWLGS